MNEKCLKLFPPFLRARNSLSYFLNLSLSSRPPPIVMQIFLANFVENGCEKTDFLGRNRGKDFCWFYNDVLEMSAMKNLLPQALRVPQARMLLSYFLLRCYCKTKNSLVSKLTFFFFYKFVQNFLVACDEKIYTFKLISLKIFLSRVGQIFKQEESFLSRPAIKLGKTYSRDTRWSCRDDYFCILPSLVTLCNLKNFLSLFSKKKKKSQYSCFFYVDDNLIN